MHGVKTSDTLDFQRTFLVMIRYHHHLVPCQALWAVEARFFFSFFSVKSHKISEHIAQCFCFKRKFPNTHHVLLATKGAAVT